MPPITTAGNGAEERGGDAGAELAELVRGADEDHVHGIDAAAHVVRRPQLDQRLAHIDADHVGAAHDDQRGDREPDDRRDAEDDGEEPEDADEEEHQKPGMVAERVGRRDRCATAIAPIAGPARRSPRPHGPDRRGCRAHRREAAPSRRRGARRRGRARSRRARSSRARCSGSRRRSSPSVAGSGIVFCAGRGMKRIEHAAGDAQSARRRRRRLPARRRRAGRRRPARRSSRPASSPSSARWRSTGSPAGRCSGAATAAPGRRRRAPCRRRRGWRRSAPPS